MTTIAIKALIASEAEHMLRLELGNRYEWKHRLADMQRGRGLGPELKPLGKLGNSNRTLFALSDVEEFIEKFRLYDKEAKAGVTIQCVDVEIDTAAPCPVWWRRKLFAPRSISAHIRRRVSVGASHAHA